MFPSKTREQVGFKEGLGSIGTLINPKAYRLHVYTQGFFILFISVKGEKEEKGDMGGGGEWKG